MSGGGGGGGSWIPTNNDACETLTEILPLNSPVPTVLRGLSPGDILEIEARPTNNSVIVVALSQGAIAGTITSAIFQRIAECIDGGFEYVAEVLEIQGAVCKVRVRRK
jgi:hypothetical protein